MLDEDVPLLAIGGVIRASATHSSLHPMPTMDGASSAPDAAGITDGTDPKDGGPIRARLIQLINWVYPKSKLIGHPSTASANLGKELCALRTELKQYADVVNKQLQNASTADATIKAMHTELVALRAEVRDLKRTGANRAADEEPPKKKARVDTPARRQQNDGGMRRGGNTRSAAAYVAPNRGNLSVNPWISLETSGGEKPGSNVSNPVVHSKVEETEIVPQVQANGDAVKDRVMQAEAVGATKKEQSEEVSEDESVEYEVAHGLDVEMDNLSKQQYLAKPLGRPPHDCTGQAMNWDSKFALWRSVNNCNETKTANRSPVTSRTRGRSSNGKPRGKPRGRTPLDSHGLPMVWDVDLNLWRSAENPAEMKPSTPRSAKSRVKQEIDALLSSDAKPIAPKIN